MNILNIIIYGYPAKSFPVKYILMDQSVGKGDIMIGARWVSSCIEYHALSSSGDHEHLYHIL